MCNLEHVASLLLLVLTSVSRDIPITTRIALQKPHRREGIPFIKNYELCRILINYSLPYAPTLRFFAFENTFEVSLIPDTTLLSRTTITVYKNNRSHIVNYKPTFYYGHARINGEFGKSEVSATVIRNVLQGHIITDNDTYHIEPAEKYAKSSSYSIVYRQNDQELSSYFLFDDENSSKNTRHRSFEQPRVRHKRLLFYENCSLKTTNNASKPQPLSCGLQLYADHRYFSTIGRGSVTNTIAQLVARYKVADAIFRGTDFNFDCIGDNFGFYLKEIHVVTDVKEIAYMLKNASQLFEALNIFSSMDTSSACLAYLFTDIPDERGVVGKAYKPDYPLSKVGICGKSFNTGLVTARHGAYVMPVYLSARVFIHELGHSCGSPHDESFQQSKCRSFVMGRYFYIKDYINSYTFSPCSRMTISPFLRANARRCLQKQLLHTCGNMIVEPPELCDCGPARICQKVDRCCTPSDSSMISVWDNPCTYRQSKRSVCSPRTSPCCTEDCQLIMDGRICSAESDCVWESRCNYTLACPTPKHKPDGLLCRSGLYCHKGRCSLSICGKHGLADCQCQDDSMSCRRCCRHPREGLCKYVSEFSLHVDDDRSHYITEGDSCKQGRGYCDSSHTCVGASVDASDFSDFIAYSRQTVENALRWMSRNWYYVCISVSCFLILSYIVRVVCRQHTLHSIEAKRIGRVVVLRREIDHCLMSMRQKIEQIEREHYETLYTERKNVDVACLRLLLLFPMTSIEKIEQAMVTCSNESIAVRHLVLQGQPIKKMFNLENHEQLIREAYLKAISSRIDAAHN